jgi:DNA-binding response OmpR family regulator/nitrogen-specific signal transduction histidine kinase
MNRSRTILVVDDAPANLALLATTLEAEGLSLRMASCGPDALRIASLKPVPDLILLDVRMPGMDGFETCRRLKADPTTARIPVLFLSAQETAELKVQAFDCGAVDYIAKPFHPQEVLARVRTHLRLVDHDELLAEIAERERVQEALRRSQELAHVGTWAWDIPSGQLEWSDEMYRIFDVPRDTASLRLPDVVAERIHPDDRPAVEESNRRVAEEGRPTPLEYRVRWRDGTERVVWGEAGSLEHDPEGAPLRLAGVVLDITEHRQSSRDRQDLVAQLEQARKLESIGRLAGGVAHSFNNMLAVIQGHAEIGLLLATPSDPLRPHLTHIQTAASRAAELTGQLMAFARRQPAEPRLVDLEERIGTLKPLLSILLGEGVHLAWKPRGIHANVRIDPSQVDQILTNLCANARDAVGGQGEVRLDVERRILDTTVTVGLESVPPGSYVALSVTDRGVGIDAAVMEHLFEPFYTTKPEGKGTGLGLATNWGIVRQNGGIIRVRSSPTEGTRFEVLLPEVVVRGAATAPGPAARGSGVAGKPGRILLVEDEPMVLDVVRHFLEGGGWQVLCATGPEQALEIAASDGDGIRLILSDVVMPGMNGRELVERLTKRWPGLAHLLMSGYTADAISRGGVLEGAWNFIEKPFGAVDLLERIAAILGSPPR